MRFDIYIYKQILDWKEKRKYEKVCDKKFSLDEAIIDNYETSPKLIIHYRCTNLHVF